MNPFTDPEVDETASTVEMPLRPRTGTSTPHQSNTTPASPTAPQTNPAPTLEMPLRPRTGTSTPHQPTTTPTSPTAPQTDPPPTLEMPLRPRPSAPASHQPTTTPTPPTAAQNYLVRIAQLEKELAESKRREQALTTHYEARETAAAAFVNDIVDATNRDEDVDEDGYGGYR